VNQTVEEPVNLVEAAFSSDGLLAQQYPGYMARPQQIEFANGIRQAIINNEVFFGEAPTGVGKSLACLVPAAEVILNDGATVVVVTSSIVLQEQYFNEVIPNLEKVLGFPLQSVLIKGRANYLCEYKHNEVTMKGNDLFNFKERKEILDWAGSTRTGDMSELDFIPKRELWHEFAALEEHECQGSRCPAYEGCHYYRQRKLVMSAKLVVCNYHYFLTAIDVEGMLPDDIRVVIMDEGHEISDIAKDFQEQKYGVTSLRGMTDAFLKAGTRAKSQHATIHTELAVNILLETLELAELQGSLESMIYRLSLSFDEHKPDDKDFWSLPHTMRYEINEMAKDHYQTLISKCMGLGHRLDRYGLPQDERHDWYDKYHEDEIKWQISIEIFRDALLDKINFIKRYFLFETKTARDDIFGPEDDIPQESVAPVAVDETIIHWIQEANDKNVTLHIKPSMAAPLMSQVLDTEIRSYTPIIISATLAVAGKFDVIQKDLGVTVPMRHLIVDSPFDLSENMLWWLPQNIPAGNDKFNHLMAAASEMLKVILVLQGKTLCLFTSNKALVASTNFIRENVPEHIHVVAQGEYPRKKIVEMMKNDAHTVIMATRSFFTGIDIQGQNLSAVLLDKFPFPMIGDPVNDYLMSLPYGFFNFSLPHAIVTIKQAFGRGNRTATDKCLVAMLDGRLATQSYKALVFNSFAFPVKATRDFTVVTEYLNNMDK
jgi:ATP-dependent DNA helicase DinG